MFSEGKMESKIRGGQFDPFWGGQFAPFRMRKLPFSGVVNLLRFEVVSLTVFSNIAFCKEKGVGPEKPFKGSFNVRLKPSLHKRAYVKAMQSGISLNRFIESTLEKELGE